MKRIRKYEPIDKRYMDDDLYRSGENGTICQIIRWLYNDTDNEEHKRKLRIAMNMAKSMVRKLVEYKKQKDELGM